MTPKTRPFEPDADYLRDRAFLLALTAFLDSLPQSPTTIVGTGQSDGTVTYREVPNPPFEWHDTLAAELDKAEARGARIARTGLRLALQDTLEVTRDLPPPVIVQLNTYLGERGLPALSAVQTRVWQTIPKVLARGRIRTQVEYYLLIERLNDVSDETLSASDRDRLAGIILDYELRQAKRRPPAA